MQFLSFQLKVRLPLGSRHPGGRGGGRKPQGPFHLSVLSVQNVTEFTKIWLQVYVYHPQLEGFSKLNKYLENDVSCVPF